MGQPVTIDRLWQGQSGQAPWLRRHGTVKRAKNMRFDLRLGGGAKRNALELVRDLDAHTSFDLSVNDFFFWTHIRGAIVALSVGVTSSSPVMGWDENGNPLLVIDQTGGGFDAYCCAYVEDPVIDLDAVSDWDTLVIVNRRMPIGVALPVFSFQESLNLIVNGDSTVTTIASSLVDKVDFFSDLDDEFPTAGNGAVFQVKFDENLDPTGYYVKFTGTPHTNYPPGYFPKHGPHWYRIPAAKGSLDPLGRYDGLTLPHRAVYDEAAGTLTLSRIPWRQRVSGNQHTNRQMPWAAPNMHILGAEFLQGRLMLISEQHVTGSRHDDYFNLWNDNVDAVSDADRIIRNVTQSHLGKLLRCRAVGQAMLLSAERGQAEFSSGTDALTSINGRITTLTTFPSRDVPMAAGPDSGALIDMHGDVHRYTWAPGDVGALVYSELLTAHTPNLFGRAAVDRLFMVENTLYVVVRDSSAWSHDTFHIEGRTIQSAWSVFEPYDDPVFFHAWGDPTRIVCRRPGTVGAYSLLHYHHHMEPPTAGYIFHPRLDRLELIPKASITYQSVADESTTRHTGRAGDMLRTYLVTRDADNKLEFKRPKRVEPNGDVVFAGDLSQIDQWMGFGFDTEIGLAELYIDLSGKTYATEEILVYHHETSGYLAEWQSYEGENPKRGDEFNAATVGFAGAGNPVMASGYMRFGVSGDPRTMEITLKSDGPGPVAWLALTYDLQPQGKV